MKIPKSSIKGPVSLKHTFDCDQDFSWQYKDSSYTRLIKDKIVKAREEENHILLEPDEMAEYLRQHLRLDDDLDEIYRTINRDEHITKAIEAFPGLRIVKEEPFLCLISYICSANSTTTNTRAMIVNISEKFGTNGAFPTPEQLAKATEKQLRECKLGFRAPYVLDAAKKIASGEFSLDELYTLQYNKSKEKLMSLNGVAHKVADCVLLFSIGKLEAFPVDVWVRRIMTELYFKGEKVSDKQIREFAQNHFGKYAGYAQEYLFHYSRTLR